MLAMHSSELKVISLMKSSIEMLQNLPYFWNMKTRTSFHSIFRILLLSALINALFYALTIPGYSLGEKYSSATWKKSMSVFMFQTYAKLGNFSKHFNLFISECVWIVLTTTYTIILLSTHLAPKRLAHNCNSNFSTCAINVNTSNRYLLHFCYFFL